MARHARSEEFAKLSGATKKHPERYKKQIPKSDHDLGLAPAHLSDAAKVVWFELEAYSLKGVLTGADRFILEVTSTLLAEYRESPGDFAVGKYTHLIGCLARLGLTPSDRQKLGTDRKPEGNPFDDF